MTKIAIYPGTFDPVTKGHIDICKRALKMFDQVVIGVADSLAKEPFFNIDERIVRIVLEYRSSGFPAC